MHFDRTFARPFAVALGLVVAVAAAACDKSIPAYDCTPGTTGTCKGAGDCAGYMVCDSTGTDYGACQCGSPPGQGDAGADTSVNDAAVASDTSTPTEASPETDAEGDAPSGDAASDAASKDAASDASAD